MAKTETIFVQSHPDQVNLMISDYNAFGWNVIGTQQITDDKGVDSYGYRHTSTYVKITFNRETDIANKAELNRLQQKYEELREKGLRKQKWLDSTSSYVATGSTSFLVFTIMVAIIGYLLSAELGGNWALILSIPMLIGIIYKIFTKRKENKSSNERYDAEQQIKKYLSEMEEIVREAEKIS